MRYENFFAWWQHVAQIGHPPLGTPDSLVFFGPADQIQVSLYPTFKAEMTDGDGMAVWSSKPVQTLYLTLHIVNGTHYRLGYDEVNDIVYISQSSWQDVVIEEGKDASRID